MTDLVHRIKVFVFRYRGSQPDYLLLRAAHAESFWGPLQGPIGFGEKLDTAIRREVLGDEEVIEWTYGFRTPPDALDVQLSPRFSAHRWASFTDAYPSLELEPDRAALLRLHALLKAA